MADRSVWVDLTISADAQVATFTLNPQLDATLGIGFDPHRAAELLSLSQAWRGLPGSVRVVLVHLDEPPIEVAQPELSDWTDLSAALAEFSSPALVSIALIRGRIEGTAMAIAMACDMRLGASDARFAIPAVGGGSVPGIGLTRRLVQLIGYSRALELCVTGQVLDALTAERAGLLSSVVPAADLSAAGAALARRIVSQPRDAVAETKALLLGALTRSQAEHESAERLSQLRQQSVVGDLDADVAAVR